MMKWTQRTAGENGDKKTKTLYGNAGMQWDSTGKTVNGIRIMFKREKEKDVMTEWRNQNVRKSLQYLHIWNFCII
jgi:hypothetical protein